MPDVPDSIKQQFADAEFPPDLVKPLVVAWSTLKTLEEAAAPEVLLDEQRRLLVNRLNTLEAWVKNFP